MLIVALVLAVIGLAALVTAVVTSNELVAWVCIGASALGVVLLVIDAIRDRKNRRLDALAAAGTAVTTAVLPSAVAAVAVDESGGDAAFEELEPEEFDAYTPEPDRDFEAAAEDYPEEVIHDEPDYDTYSDDESEYPAPAEEAAMHVFAPADLDVETYDDTVVLGNEIAETTSTSTSAVVYSSSETIDATPVNSTATDATTVYIVRDEGS